MADLRPQPAFCFFSMRFHISQQRPCAHWELPAFTLLTLHLQPKYVELARLGGLVG